MSNPLAKKLSLNGGWLIGDGTITGGVNVAGGGAISAGDSPGHLTITGDYDQDGTLLAELGGTLPGEALGSYDWIDVGGAATMAGLIDVDFVDGFVAVPGNVFDILTAANGIPNVDLGDLTFDFSDAQTGLYWWRTIVPLGGRAEALRLQVSPEPTSLALLGLGALGLLRRRRRR